MLSAAERRQQLEAKRAARQLKEKEERQKEEDELRQLEEQDRLARLAEARKTAEKKTAEMLTKAETFRKNTQPVEGSSNQRQASREVEESDEDKPCWNCTSRGLDCIRDRYVFF